MQFDIDHNGMTYILPSTNGREKLANSSNFDQAPRAADWKALNAFYVMKCALKIKSCLYGCLPPMQKPSKA